MKNKNSDYKHRMNKFKINISVVYFVKVKSKTILK